MLKFGLEMGYKKRLQSGFSLVELSVVMTVIGITLGGALTLATQKTEAEKVNETEAKLDLIEQSLERYLIENQRLPCPANGSVKIDAAGFGEETTPDATPQCSGASFNDGGSIYGGVVPVKTLELADDVMFDGWDRRITYAVDANYANSGPGSPTPTNASCDGPTTSDVCFQYYDAATSIIIRNDVDPAGTAEPENAVYILISHGKNGFGAFRRFGSVTRNAASADVREQENAEPSTAPHNSYDNTFIQAATSSTFDDMVRYRTKALLVLEAQGITDESLCSAARDVFEHSGANATCADLADPTVCEALGTRVHSLCLLQ